MHACCIVGKTPRKVIPSEYPWKAANKKEILLSVFRALHSRLPFVRTARARECCSNHSSGGHSLCKRDNNPCDIFPMPHRSICASVQELIAPPRSGCMKATFSPSSTYQTILPHHPVRLYANTNRNSAELIDCRKPVYFCAKLK